MDADVLNCVGLSLMIVQPLAPREKQNNEIRNIRGGKNSEGLRTIGIDLFREIWDVFGSFVQG